ncbi:Hypoxia-inducible factor 1-alpha inhibitor [Porphyridium purpureum]|uniref:Hypoxia-inducible factor 1-alpha inhibitor n=1 Tax=Porphyridium purpureum TaxID=35688 RepID=A0A5J4YY49_PORPP|nr:Hypoxia-inducible factor 1-alpha inhibitor [Porphyridium purpureum]|eukprot:POR5591..scf209_3
MFVAAPAEAKRHSWRRAWSSVRVACVSARETKVDRARGAPQRVVNGILKNDASLDKVAPRWIDATRFAYARLVDALAALFPHHSLPLAVYLRGSVARGFAVDGSSDIDLILYLDYELDEDQVAWVRRCVAAHVRRSARFHFVAGVDIRIHSLGKDLLDVLSKPGGTKKSQHDLVVGVPDCHVIKGQAAWLGGCFDLCHWLPELGPGTASLDSLFTRFFRARHTMRAAGASSEERWAACAWFMKSVIRAAVELLFLEGHEAEETTNATDFARDLVPAVAILSRVYPEKALSFETALAFACCGISEADLQVDLVVSLAEDLFGWVESRYVRSAFDAYNGSKEAEQREAFAAMQTFRPSTLRKLSRSVSPTRKKLSRLWNDLDVSLFGHDVDVDGLIRDQTQPLFLFDDDSEFTLPSLGYDICDGKSTAEILRHIRMRSKPLLVHQAASSWPALKRWNLKYLSTILRSRKLSVRVSEIGPLFVFCSEAHIKVRNKAFPAPSWSTKMTMQMFWENCRSIRRAKSPKRYYVQDCVPDALLCDLNLQEPWTHIPVIEGFAQEARIWISCQGATSSLHYDNADSFLVQIQGSKRVTLFPPSVLAELDPYGLDHPLRRRCRTGFLWSGGVEQALRQQSVQVVLRPGDALYFPRDWAHHVESLTYSVSLGWRWW